MSAQTKFVAAGSVGDTTDYLETVDAGVIWQGSAGGEEVYIFAMIDRYSRYVWLEAVRVDSFPYEVLKQLDAARKRAGFPLTTIVLKPIQCFDMRDFEELGMEDGLEMVFAAQGQPWEVPCLERFQKTFFKAVMDEEDTVIKLCLRSLQAVLDKHKATYIQRAHDALDNETPANVVMTWLGNHPIEDADLNHIGDRVVQKKGVGIAGAWYISPKIAELGLIGKLVQVYQVASDSEYVYLFNDGECLCACVNVSHLDADSKTQLAIGLKEAAKAAKAANSRALASITYEDVCDDVLSRMAWNAAQFQAMRTDHTVEEAYNDYFAHVARIMPNHTLHTFEEMLGDEVLLEDGSSLVELADEVQALHEDLQMMGYIFIGLSDDSDLAKTMAGLGRTTRRIDEGLSKLAKAACVA